MFGYNLMLNGVIQILNILFYTYWRGASKWTHSAILPVSYDINATSSYAALARPFIRRNKLWSNKRAYVLKIFEFTIARL